MDEKFIIVDEWNAIAVDTITRAIWCNKDEEGKVQPCTPRDEGAVLVLKRSRDGMELDAEVIPYGDKARNLWRSLTGGICN